MIKRMVEKNLFTKLDKKFQREISFDNFSKV